MDESRNLAKNPASNEEKKILRNFVAREATPEERDSFLVKNYAHLSDKARGVFMEMSATDQFRVIFDGPMKESRDAVEILYGRVKRFMDMELQIRGLSSRTGKEQEKAKKQPSAKMQELSERIAHSLANPTYEEVPVNERRCSGVDQKLEDTKPKVLEGTVKGVGGVIEAMQKKYAMIKGERLRVVNETKDLWKLEGEKTVPKAQVNTGWKWVIKGGEDELKKKADEQARKKAAKEEEARKKAEAAKNEVKKDDSKSKEKRKKEKNGKKEKESRKEKEKGKKKKDSKNDKGRASKSRRAESAESESEEEEDSESESRRKKSSKKAKVKAKKSKKRKRTSSSEESSS